MAFGHQVELFPDLDVDLDLAGILQDVAIIVFQ